MTTLRAATKRRIWIERIVPGRSEFGATAGGPLVGSAALEALQICSDPELLQSVRVLGERLAAGLAELPAVASVRGRGLMVGIDLHEGVSATDLAQRALLEQRLVVNATGPATIRFEPPLIGTESEIDEALARLGELMRGDELNR